MLLCKKCGNKTILATAFVICFEPDEEPYKSGVREKCGYEDGLAAEVTVGIHWCPKCEEIVDVWIEEPMEKDVRDMQLEADNKRLKEAVGLLNSMVLSGEKHTETSKKVVDQALKRR